MTPPRSTPFRSFATIIVAAGVLYLLAVAAPAGAATGYRLSRTFGTDGPGKLQNPHRLAVSPATGDVFTVDTDARQVYRYTTSGDFVGTFDVSSAVRVDDRDATFVAADPSDGDVYVAGLEPPPPGSDVASGQAAIARYHPDGELVGTIDLTQAGPDGVTRIGGLAVDSAGRLYVSDRSSLSDGTNRNVVQVFDANGVRIRAFDGSDGPSPFANPGALAVGTDDGVFVLDDAVVRRFTPAGGGYAGTVDTGYGASTLAADPADGSLFAQGNTSGVTGVERYDADGTPLDRFGFEPGDDVDGVAYDPSGGTVFLLHRSPQTGAPAVDVYVPFAAPGVTAVEAATAVTGHSARFGGSVDPDGRPTTVVAVYTDRPGDPGTTLRSTPPVDVGAGDDPVPVSVPLIGLRPRMTYTVWLRATNDLGSVDSRVRELNTPAIPPTVSSGEASAITSTSATVSGSIDGENAPASVFFDYGTTTAYGTSTEIRRKVGVEDVVVVDAGAPLMGLDPNTTYHYRAVATALNDGADVVSHGEDRTFTTAPPAPRVSTSADGARFETAVATGGVVGRATFVVSGTSNAFAATTEPQALAATAGPQAVSGVVDGLPPGGSYSVRASVQTAAGIALSDPATFTTPAVAASAAPAAFAIEAFPSPCSAPRLNGPRGTVRAGSSVTLTGADLGSAARVTFGSRPAKVTRWRPGRVTVVVPAKLSGRVPLTVSCGRASPAVTVRVARPAPSNRFGVRLVARGSRISAHVTVPGRGIVTIAGARVARRTGSVSRAGTVRVRTGLSRRGRAALTAARSGRLSVTVKVAFRPAGGTSRTLERRLVLRR